MEARRWLSREANLRREVSVLVEKGHKTVHVLAGRVWHEGWESTRVAPGGVFQEDLPSFDVNEFRHQLERCVAQVKEVSSPSLAASRIPFPIDVVLIAP